MWRNLLVIAMFLQAPALAEAQQRRAFIVGVQNYTELEKLTRTVEDANGYTSVFGKDLGYAVTSLATSPTRSQFNQAFGAFLETIRPGDEVVFVFSGHGWSDGAENYLALADAKRNTSEFERKEETVALSRSVLQQIRARQPAVIVAIIDACRDNPFDGLTKSGFDKGLARIEAQKGMLVVYAAGEEQKALDRLGNTDKASYSVFTRTLLPKLRNGSRPLMESLDETRDEVERLAGTILHKQRPAVYSDVSLKFCLSGKCAPTPPVNDAETVAWLGIAAAKDNAALCAAYRAHEIAYPSGLYAASARQLSSNLCTLPTPAQVTPGEPVAVAPKEQRFAVGEIFRDAFKYGGGQGPEMVVVPSGEFLMGSPSDEEWRYGNEGPQRTVRIGYHLAVGKYEVTWTQYLACVSAGACPAAEDDGSGQGSRPVTNLSWDDAKRYITWLSGKTEETYRLLTEAEWEYAARAGTTGAYSFGNDANRGCGHMNGADVTASTSIPAWLPTVTCDDGYLNTAPVGSFSANAFGINDMHGNVHELVEDCYAESYVSHPTDGSSFYESSCRGRVFRGGSWQSMRGWLRSASRNNINDVHSGRDPSIGFRVARALP